MVSSALPIRVVYEVVFKIPLICVRIIQSHSDVSLRGTSRGAQGEKRLRCRVASQTPRRQQQPKPWSRATRRSAPEALVSPTYPCALPYSSIVQVLCATWPTDSGPPTLSCSRLHVTSAQEIRRTAKSAAHKNLQQRLHKTSFAHGNRSALRLERKKKLSSSAITN